LIGTLGFSTLIFRLKIDLKINKGGEQVKKEEARIHPITVKVCAWVKKWLSKKKPSRSGYINDLILLEILKEKEAKKK